jgi:four helix bundle protein
MQDFRRLKVWAKAHAVALEIFRITERLPRREGLALRSQLRRAALSIAANIAEGAGKSSNAEFHRYLQIALGSASETLYHLLLARDTGALPVTRYNQLANQIVEVRRMLTGLSKRVGGTNGIPPTPSVTTRRGCEEPGPPSQSTISADD